MGYWRKVKFGKKLLQPKFPEQFEGREPIYLEIGEIREVQPTNEQASLSSLQEAVKDSLGPKFNASGKAEWKRQENLRLGAIEDAKRHVEERNKRKEQDFANFKELFKIAALWRAAMDLRGYIPRSSF
ncbi:MAG: hypothetical protein INR73_24260 [Williamsia sp.]|nr:hypothetical protein [Williamsia sp.]